MWNLFMENFPKKQIGNPARRRGLGRNAGGLNFNFLARVANMA